jgi:hypothetical protein
MAQEGLTQCSLGSTSVTCELVPELQCQRKKNEVKMRVEYRRRKRKDLPSSYKLPFLFNTIVSV